MCRVQGAALGAQEDVVNSLHIFIAIQAHKGLAAYALGSSIVESDADVGQVRAGKSAAQGSICIETASSGM